MSQSGSWAQVNVMHPNLYDFGCNCHGPFTGRLRRLFARRRLRKGFERVSSKDVNKDELQRLHQSDNEVNSDSDDYATNHQRA